MFNIRSVDLNLLPVLEAVYEEQNLGRAAERLAMTPSAMSHALSRLRTVFQDELFVRHSRGVVATAAADRIYAKVRSALAQVREAVLDARGFDPATSERRFFVSIAHPMGPMITLRLQERLARIAPQVEVVASTRSRPLELSRELREGRVDAAIDWLAPAGAQVRSLPLFDDALVVVARSGHPALTEGADSTSVRSHRFVTLRPRSEHSAASDQWQRLRGFRDESSLEVSEYIEVLMVSSQSELLALIPRTMQGIANCAFGLRRVQAFPATADLSISLFWHASRDADRGHAFLRQELAAVAAETVQLA